MGISIKDPATEAAIRRLSELTGSGLTDTIREAVEADYRRRRQATPLAERLQAIGDAFAAFPACEPAPERD